jgi:hypothetical protein
LNRVSFIKKKTKNRKMAATNVNMGEAIDTGLKGTTLKTPLDKLEYQRQYNAEHAEEIRKYQQKYYEEHRTERIERQKERNKANKEELKKTWAKYAIKHRAEIKERRHSYGTYNCECGSLNLLVLNRTTHEKTKKHAKHLIKQ